MLSVLLIVTLYWTYPPSISAPAQYPESLTRFFQMHDLNGKVLNDPQDGGYLSYKLWPDVLIYADTPDELYLGTSIFEDYYLAIVEKKIPELLSKYEPDYILGDLSRGDAISPLFYSNYWALVYV